MIQIIGGEALVLNLRDETVFALNPTGARIAELLRQRLTIDDAIGALCEEYGAAREEIAPDVYALVDALLSKGLVVPARDEGAS